MFINYFTYRQINYTPDELSNFGNDISMDAAIVNALSWLSLGVPKVGVYPSHSTEARVWWCQSAPVLPKQQLKYKNRLRMCPGTNPGWSDAKYY